MSVKLTHCGLANQKLIIVTPRDIFDRLTKYSLLSLLTKIFLRISILSTIYFARDYLSMQGAVRKVNNRKPTYLLDEKTYIKY